MMENTYAKIIELRDAKLKEVKDAFVKPLYVGYTNSGYQTREQFMKQVGSNLKNFVENHSQDGDILEWAKRCVNELFSGLSTIVERDVENNWYEK